MADETDQTHFRKLELEIEKLEIDIQKLKESEFFDKWVSKIIPVLPVLLGIAAFLFGVYQYNNQQKVALQQQKEVAERAGDQREREILKPFLDKRTEIYFEVSAAAATIAVSTDSAERATAELKFRELYTGQMIIVEDAPVESAMMDFMACLNASNTCDGVAMRQKSLSLSSRIRESVRDSLNVKLDDLQGK